MAAPPAAGRAGAAARLPLAARNAWRKQQAAPLRPPAAGRTAGAATAPRTPPPAGAPLLPAGPTPVSSGALTPASKQCLLPAPRPVANQAAEQQGRERCLPDAGLFAGTSFRSGWAPNAVVAHAGGRNASAAHIVVRQVAVGARVAPAGEAVDVNSPFQQRQRQALEAALRLHMQHSSPDPASAAEDQVAAAAAAAADSDDMSDGGGSAPAASAAATAGVPQWRLRCRAQGELRQLTLQYIQLCNAAAAEVGVYRALVVPSMCLPVCLPAHLLSVAQALFCTRAPGCLIA